MHPKTGEIVLRGDMSEEDWQDLKDREGLVPVATSPVAQPNRLTHGRGKRVKAPVAKDMRFRRNRGVKP
jgi:hypothetical protein